MTKKLADASDWVHYGPGRTSVDLRCLPRTFAVLAPLHTKHDDSIEFMTRDGTDAGAVVVARPLTASRLLDRPLTAPPPRLESARAISEVPGGGIGRFAAMRAAECLGVASSPGTARYSPRGSRMAE